MYIYISYLHNHLPTHPKFYVSNLLMALKRNVDTTYSILYLSRMYVLHTKSRFILANVTNVWDLHSHYVNVIIYKKVLI